MLNGVNRREATIKNCTKCQKKCCRDIYSLFLNRKITHLLGCNRNKAKDCQNTKTQRGNRSVHIFSLTRGNRAVAPQLAIALHPHIRKDGSQPIQHGGQVRVGSLKLFDGGF